jgi:tetratricopeptide (TPR) repeat protein
MNVSNPSLCILFLVLLCLVIPAAGAAPAASISSVAADTEGPPPQDASAYISDAKAAVVERNWTSALLLTTRGIAWYPDNADLLCLQGYAYLKMGQYQKSVDVVSRGILLDPGAVRYANRGYGYLALKNYSAALSDAEAGIAADGNYTANYGVKALALQGMGQSPEALAVIETAINQSPDNAHYWQEKGRILAASGDCSGAAAAAFERSIELDPEYSLPWPGFGSAGEDLAALNAACTPASPTPTKSPSGWITVAVALGAVIALGIKR